ncbi:dnaJ homolog subfamily B member 9-like [Saccostrea echinata]|uniref:dnaJ homolog subfamily B member 9-like n=1 Tax=Saccostrea echinata TaxID=191078 RepID=UPI002A80DF0C|nr:dnaJ homolog subfamily B member 9-like [Saccostrea echinata]
MMIHCLRKGIASNLHNFRSKVKFTCIFNFSNVPFKNYYKILNIEFDASAQEVKEAYLKLSKTYHPDVNQSEDAKRIFQEITEAYAVLGSVNERKQYDSNSLVSRLKKQRPTQKREEKDTDRATFEQVHRAYKKNLIDEEELFSEWRRIEDEKRRRHFEEHMYMDPNFTEEKSGRLDNIWKDIWDRDRKYSKESTKSKMNLMMFGCQVLFAALVIALILEKVG